MWKELNPYPDKEEKLSVEVGNAGIVYATMFSYVVMAAILQEIAEPETLK